MKTQFEKACAFSRLLLLALAISFAGCKKAAPPVEPISIESAVAELGKAFGTATGKAKSLANDASKAITAKEYAAAGQALSGLTSIPEITADQRSVASRCLISVNEKLQEAAAQGSPEAIQQIQIHNFTK